METSILNDISVIQLYDYPESGILEKKLVFLVISLDKKENHLIHLELSDLKYKIRNVFISDERDLNKGDYIVAKKFLYSYEENVNIKIIDFEIIKSKTFNFLNGFEEYKKDIFLDCYFLYKKSKNAFIGFNNETLVNTDEIINSKSKFEDSKIYLFKRLQKINDKEVRFIQKISFISEKLGQNICDKFSNLSCHIPYFFEGKIIEIYGNKILLVCPEIDDIFISLEVTEMNEIISENNFIKVIAAKYNSTNGNILNLTSTEFTKVCDAAPPEKEDQRIYLKFKFDGNIMYNKISKLMIQLPNESFQEFKIENKYIYYMYTSKNLESNIDSLKQNVILIYNQGFSRKFQYFVYKGLLNEANIDITKVGVCAYEFLYYSLYPEYLPTFIEIENVGKFDNFQTFGNKTRKKITFINIPIQNKEDIGHGNSFLVINLCKKNEIKSYGTLKLNSIEFKPYKEYDIDSTIDEFLKDIHEDFINYFKNDFCNIEELEEKYLKINKEQCDAIKEEINKNLLEYIIKDEKHTFDYFNSLVIWNIFSYYSKIKSDYGEMENYFKIYEKLVKRKDLNYVDKSKVLIDIFNRLIESKITLVFPELYFYDELKDNNPYKIAYDFQFTFIDALSETSGLFLPFLLLDSYFMDLICYKNLAIREENIKNGVISAYSISMLTLDCIKKHLKKTIKPYFFIIRKGISDERKYYASVHKFNNIITYNEKILLSETAYQKIDFKEKLSTKKDYAFILFFENMHENFSHNKENLLNKQESPTLFFNDKLEFSYAYDYDIKQIGEAGVLLESFICENETLEEMKKLKYEMGEYLDIKFFIDKDFSQLLKKFDEKRIQYINENKDKDVDVQKYLEGYRKFNDVKTEINKKAEFEKAKENEKQEKEKDTSTENIEKQETVHFSRYNKVIITGETMEELEKKIQDMKNKKFIKADNAVPSNNDKTCY